MKIVTLITTAITLLLLAATLVCGLWIKVFGVTDPGPLNFHMISGVAALVFCFITFLLVISLVRKKPSN